jgi:hypothetical protein
MIALVVARTTIATIVSTRYQERRERKKGERERRKGKNNEK